MIRARACFPGCNSLFIDQTMSALALRAHAKINLYLEVGDRLDSGYHEIRSVMQSLDLADTIVLSAASELIFECDNPALANDDNLVMRAARLLQSRFARGQGARIKLFKKVPVAAGLGGGSADAAAALVGLNRFWSLGLQDADLMSLAPELGADVAFCLFGGTALVCGFGDNVEKLASVDLGPVLIIKPSGGLAAGSVYSRFDDLGLRAAPGTSEALAAVAEHDRDRLIGSAANDLEAAAISLLPSIAAIKDIALRAGASACFVSGSGPALVAFAESKDRLESVAQAVADLAETWVTAGSDLGSEIITDKNEIERLAS